MAKSLAEIIQLGRIGIDEVDVRYWVQRHAESLVGAGVRCSEVKEGRIVLIAEEATLRQELHLLKENIRAAAQAKTGYSVTEVVIRRYGG